jgi:hypothetical protein
MKEDLDDKQNENDMNVVKRKKRRKNHSKLGKDYQPIEGKFGWVVVFAAGLSNVK